MSKISPPVLEVSAERCRRFLLQASNLASPLPTVSEAIRYHGYVQIDPIDVCGRMHDLILRNRVCGYLRDGLFTLLYGPGERKFFEHYLPERGVLVALPVEDYRYLRPAMRLRARASGTWGVLSPAEKKIASRILRRLREGGPLGVAALADGERSTGAWGTTGTLAKHTLDKLCFQGRVLVSRREKFRRIYDLPERVLPTEILAAKPPSPREQSRWLIRKALQQRRLARLSPAQQALAGDEVQAVRVPGQSMLFCLREDAERLQGALPKPSARPLLLAPLDPIIYDRKLTESLWGFRYTWEVYLPPTKRVRGYYALPVLNGARLVGHVDPKADRTTDTLRVRSAIPSDIDVSPALAALARFLELDKVVVACVG